MKTLDQIISSNSSNDIALIDQDLQLSYRELNVKINFFAYELLKLGIQPGDVVVIKMNKTWKAIVAMFSVLKIRAAYIIIEAKLPRSENLRKLANIKISYEIDDFSFSEMVNCQQKAASCIFPSVLTSDVCYMYLTSGSTGDAKACVFDHSRAMQFVLWASSYFNFSKGDRVACISPLAFDVCILDIFVTFSCKATLVIVPDTIKLFKNDLNHYLKNFGINVIQIVPSFLAMLDAKLQVSLSKIIFTGQSLSKAQFESLRGWNNLDFYNLYGQTEANSYVCYQFTAAEEFPIPVAKLPLPSYLEIKNHELWISQHTLMISYYGESEIQSYNTKDLVVIKNDKLYIIGRSDNLIKVQGHRISPEALEKVMGECVRQCIVFFDSHADQLKIIVEEIETEGIEGTKAIVGKYCHGKLPPYQIPREIMVIKKLPLSSNGKVDRKKILADFSQNKIS